MDNIALLGLEIVPIVVFNSTTGERVAFAKQEFQVVETPLGLPVMGLLESIGGISSAMQLEGFADVGTVELSFNDLFGNFLYLIQNVPRSTKYVLEVYVLLRSTGMPAKVYKLFVGVVDDPMKYEEKTRTYHFTVSTNQLFLSFGFQPDYEAYTYMSANASQEPWPQVFGQTQLPLVALCTAPTSTLSEKLVFCLPFDDDPDNVTKLIQTWPLKYRKLGDLSNLTFLIKPEDAEKMPQGETIDVELGIQDQKIRCRGHFAGSSFMVDPPTTGTDGALISGFNLPILHWSTDGGVCVWAPRQVTQNWQQTNIGYGDAIQYEPNVIVMQGYGSYEPTTTFNGQGDLTPPAVLEGAPFEMGGVGFETPTIPWLEGSYLNLKVYSQFKNMVGEWTAKHNTLWAFVAKQDGLVLYLSNVTNEMDQDVSLAGYKICYIAYAIKNKIFLPWTTEMQNRGTVRSQVRSTGCYLPSHAEDPFPYFLGFGFLENASLTVVDWWPLRTFPVSLDCETLTNTLYIKRGINLQPLTTGKDYYMIQYRVSDDQLTGEWECNIGFPTLNVPQWLQTAEAGYQGTCPFLPKEVRFLCLTNNYWEMIRSALASEQAGSLVLDVINNFNTDEKVFKHVLEQYTGYICGPQGESYPVNCYLRQKEDVKSILGTLAREFGKTVQSFDGSAWLVDFMQTTSTPGKQSFNEGNTDNSESVNISTLERGDIKNKYTIKFPNVPGLWIFRDNDSIRVHTEMKTEHTVMFNFQISKLVEGGNPQVMSSWNTEHEDPLNPHSDFKYPQRGINKVMYFWLSHTKWQLLEYTISTYIDALFTKSGLLICGDFISLDYQQELKKIGPEDACILALRPTDCTDVLPYGKKVFIKGSTMDLNTGVVTITTGDLPIVR